MDIKNKGVFLKSEDTVNGDGSYFKKYWELSAERVGSFLFKALHMIYTNLTIYNVIIISIKYIPMMLYMEKFIRNIYKESRKRMKQRNAEIEDILLKLDIVNAKIPCQEAEFREREEALRRCTEQLHVVRAQVRQMIAKNEDLRQELKLPIDVLHLHINKTSEEESKLFEDLIKEYKYEQKGEIIDEKIPFDKMYDTVGSVNGNTINNSDENRDYTIKIVKVTNVYKMSYLQHYLKQKRLQRAKDAILKKKTNNTQKLFNDWHNTLNAVTKKEYTVDSGIATGEAMGDHRSYEVLHTTTEEDKDEPYPDYDLQTQNPCLTYGNYCDEDLAPESEIMSTDYTSKVYDSRYNYPLSVGDKSVLSVLPEETSSEIEIERLDVN